MSDLRDDARLLLNLAETLEMGGNPRFAGVLRRYIGSVTAEISRLARTDNTKVSIPVIGGCPVCGAPITQPARGRHRIYCSDDHRRQADANRRRAA